MQEINVLQLFNGLQAAQAAANKTGKNQIVKLSDFAEKPKTAEKPTGNKNSNKQ